MTVNDTNDSEQRYKWQWTTIQMTVTVNNDTNDSEQRYKWQWTTIQMTVDNDTNDCETTFFKTN